MAKTIIKYALIVLCLIIVVAIVYLAFLFVGETLCSNEEEANSIELKSDQSFEYLIDENNYQQEMDNVVVPYITQFENTGRINTDDGLSLYYIKYIVPGAKGSICLCYGCCEYIEKYNEIIYYFLKNNFNVYALDLRGHGDSDREINNNELIYVKSFDKYVSDYKMFLNQIVNDSLPKYLYAHSMGGAVSAILLEEMPDYFESAILSSPMIKYSSGDVPLPIAKFLSLVMCSIGKEKDMCMGLEPYSTEFKFENSLGNSRARYNYIHTLTNNNVNFQTSAVTYGWLRTCSYDLDNMYDSDNLYKIYTKCCVFKAENDTMVKNYGIDHFANHVGGSICYNVPGSKHEIYLNDNSCVSSYMSAIFKFLNN